MQIRSSRIAEPLFALRLRAHVCSRSHAEAVQTYQTFYRIEHYVWYRRKPPKWQRPFRVVEEEEHPLVPLGETRDVCGPLDFEDVFPPTTTVGPSPRSEIP